MPKLVFNRLESRLLIDVISHAIHAVSALDVLWPLGPIGVESELVFIERHHAFGNKSISVVLLVFHKKINFVAY